MTAASQPEREIIDMRPNPRHAALLAATFALPLAFAGPVFADDRPGKDWMSMEQAATKLSEAGYTNVRKLKADDGYWEAKATKDGKTIEVKVDPRSGAVSEDQDDDD